MASAPPRRGAVRDLFPAAALLLCGLGALTVASLLSTAVEGQYVVVAPPSFSQLQAARIVAEAGGALIGAGGFDNIIMAASERADFAVSLREAGAWLVLPAPRFLGCGVPEVQGSFQ
jgi:hypothetical protein